MSYTKTTQTYTQDRMARYIVLIVCLSVTSALWGMISLFSTSSVAYQVSQYESQIAQMNQDIAELESSYYIDTQNLTIADATVTVEEYSPASGSLRYARVGGATYSLLTQSR